MKTLLSILMISACGSMMVACTHTPTQTITMSSNMTSKTAATALVQSIYAGFAEGDMAKVTGAMADDIVWNEAQGNPYADLNPYLGPDKVLSGLFSRIGGEWDYFNATPDEFIVDGDRVVVIGQYDARHKTTNKTLDAPFVHVWTVQNGELTTFQQYTDTAAHVDAMQTGFNR